MPSYMELSRTLSREPCEHRKRRMSRPRIPMRTARGEWAMKTRTHIHPSRPSLQPYFYITETAAPRVSWNPHSARAARFACKSKPAVFLRSICIKAHRDPDGVCVFFVCWLPLSIKCHYTKCPRPRLRIDFRFEAKIISPKNELAMRSREQMHYHNRCAFV